VQSAELERLRPPLRDAGVPGAEDFGRFVNDTRHFRPSALDTGRRCPSLSKRCHR
jgi:hypothetical protein